MVRLVQGCGKVDQHFTIHGSSWWCSSERYFMHETGHKDSRRKCANWNTVVHMYIVALTRRVGYQSSADGKSMLKQQSSFICDISQDSLNVAGHRHVIDYHN